MYREGREGNKEGRGRDWEKDREEYGRIMEGSGKAEEDRGRRRGK